MKNLLTFSLIAGMSLSAALVPLPAYASSEAGSAARTSIDGDYDPVADSKAIVVSGRARFTVLTDRLIRMEWSEDGGFEDRASLAIINRKMPVPEYSSSRAADGSLLIKTGAVTLRYSGDDRFDENNLSVSFKLNGKNVVWHPGLAADGNLKGTMRTLDRIYSRNKEEGGFNKNSKTTPVEKLEDGVLSRDGWAIVDESERQLLEKNGSDWGEWVCERPAGDRQDLYIFAYGHDYTGALQDFTRVAGKIPMPPKYALGYWWSRYWAYTDDQFLEIAHELKDRGVPSDVFIIDMDWHRTWPELKSRRGGKDNFGQGIGWTGYTWNTDLIADPEGMLREIHSLGFKTALNLHPASGIEPYEARYRDFVDDYLSRTDDYDGPKDYIYGEEQYQFAGTKSPVGKPGYSAPVPFRIDQQEWADAYFNSIIRPLERQGVDFWWLDWQQWKMSRYTKDLSNTFWLNWCFFNDKKRQSLTLGKDADRPMIYHRWGGLGSHRYQLGFSGDVYDEWDALRMLPYFTSTASNVCYGYWGHDIGGHMQREQHMTDPEMYTRWIQYGVFTPIFKTHSTASKYVERKIWAYPTHYPYLKAAIELRYQLSPYIYDAARQAYDTGVSICRPMYYHYPEEEKAYSFDEQNMFGDLILSTVLCTPADPQTGLTERTVWFPKGCEWYDMAKNCLYKGGSVKTLYYSIDQNPWYVKAGSVIPVAEPGLMDLQTPDNALRPLVIPGKGACTYVHYEGDGKSQAYEEKYATTLIEKKGKTLTIHPRKGDYKGAFATRRITIQFAGSDRVIELPESPVGEKVVVKL